MRNSIKRLGGYAFVPFLFFLKIVMRFVTVRTFVGNSLLFGHLSLEPEKYLCSIDQSAKLDEIGFNGSKIPGNIGLVDCKQPETKWVFDIWTLGNSKIQANKALVKMWKRNLRVFPSQVIDLMLKANAKFSSPPIIDYRFSTLLSAEKYLDESERHLTFTSKEVNRGKELLLELGVPLSAPYVCIVTREGDEEESSLRNKDINDLSELIQALVNRGIFVIRLGGPNSGILRNSGGMVIDYAHSKHKSADGDVFLIAHCRFLISTMTGPDALALAFRKNVLLLDISHYGLLFSGTKLVTWVPSILSKDKENLSITEVFKCEAGWFWKDSQFRENGIAVAKSTPAQIAIYGIELLDRLESEQPDALSDLEKKSQTEFQNAMGELGAAWHGTVRCRIPVSFLEQNKSWFLT